MSDTLTRKVGDKVGVDHPKHPGTWTVKKLGPANAVLESADGHRTLRAPYSLLTDPPTTVNGAEVTVVPVVEYYHLGELVRVTSGKHAGLYVVIKDSGEKVNLAKLGGDNDRYLRAIKRGLERVDPKDVLK